MSISNLGKKNIWKTGVYFISFKINFPHTPNSDFFQPNFIYLIKKFYFKANSPQNRDFQSKFISVLFKLQKKNFTECHKIVENYVFWGHLKKINFNCWSDFQTSK